MAGTEPEHERGEEEEAATAVDDEDTGAQVAPIVKLEEVAVSTGEEDEDAILDLYGFLAHSSECLPHYGFRYPCYYHSFFEFVNSIFFLSLSSDHPSFRDRAGLRKAKLYRFDKDGNQWKERGAGSVKLLKHKEAGKVRLVMRQSKTLKICANHLVLPTMTVQEHSGNDKSCVWHASDFADGELKDELFCIRFASIENCKTFMEMFMEVAESQEKKEEDKDATSAAGLLKKLSVEEKGAEDKAGEHVTPAGKKSEHDS